MIEKIRNTIQKYNMLEIGDKVIAGVSGGPDSVALLLNLNELKKEYNITLKVGHVDHMIRGEESRKDMEFVKSLTKDLDIDFCFKKIDVKKLAKTEKESVEKVARLVRYSFFKEIARQENFNKIALGHNMDDSIETVLMHIIRGTGLSGLKGIVPVRNIDPNLLLIRPLIEISSQEIREYLKKSNIPYRLDSTNQEQIYFRNEIRHKLLPILEKYNTNIRQLLLNLSNNILVIDDYITKRGKKRYKSAANKKDNKIVIDLRRFRRYHPAIKREIFRNAIRDLKGNLKRITHQHWHEFEMLTNERPTGSIVDLPYGMAAEKMRSKILFYKKTEDRGQEAMDERRGKKEEGVI